MPETGACADFCDGQTATEAQIAIAGETVMKNHGSVTGNAWSSSGIGLPASAFKN
jgi:hypothetical protein